MNNINSKLFSVLGTKNIRRNKTKFYLQGLHILEGEQSLLPGKVFKQSTPETTANSHKEHRHASQNMDHESSFRE